MVELLPHQTRVQSRLRSGTILRGGVGSGKSISALAYYYESELKGQVHPAAAPTKSVPLYIITTAKKRDTLEWEKECANFGLSTHQSHSVRSTLVVIDSWNNIKKYEDVKDAFFIFDEQRLVGTGVWVKTFLKIAKNNRWIMLTATPGDDWVDYIPVFIANGFYRNRTHFIVSHVVYKRYSNYPQIDHYVNVDELVKHRDAIVIDMAFKHNLRFHKAELLANYDKALMDRVTRDRWNVFTDRPLKTAGEMCYAQRRIANSDRSRLEFVKLVHSKHLRLIVFYNFNYELELLREYLTSEGITFSEWNGHKHEPVPITDNWIYLVQYTAGAEGWECITTNAVLMFSQHYSYKVKIQAEGRVARLNTEYEDIYYYYIRSRAPIDLAIARAIKRKKNFNERVYEKEAYRRVA